MIESALLLRQADGEQLISTACRAIRESGCDGAASDTGFHLAGGATVDAIRLIRKHAESLEVIACGGISESGDAEQFFGAGADRAIVSVK